MTMKDLNYTQISAGMTAKERACLVVKLQLKAFDEVGTKEVEVYPYQSEISQIVAACPDYQARDYNFYIDLKEEVWKRILPTLEILLLELALNCERSSRLMQMITMSPFVNEALQFVRNLPKVVSLEEYQEGIKKAKEIIKAEALPIEGRFGLAQEESFYRLIAEGEIHKDSDLTAYIDLVEASEKTEEELLKEAVGEVKDAAQRYVKHKERTGVESRIWKKYKKYVGLSDEEIAKEIKEHESEWIEKLDSEEYELWSKTLNEERERLLSAVKNGELKWITAKKKKYDKEKKEFYTQDTEGIEAGSYYTWDKRNQRFAGEKDATVRYYNPLSEDCIEMGYVKGLGVAYAGDPKLDNDGYKWNRILIAAPHDYNFKWFLGKQKADKKSVIQFLKSMLPLRVKKGEPKEEKAYLKFAGTRYEVALKIHIKRIYRQIRRIRNRIELIKQIETRHFDGSYLVSRNPQNPFGAIVRAENDIKYSIEEHNKHLTEVTGVYSLLSFGIWDYEFIGLQDFLLTDNVKPNLKWVEKELDEIEGRLKK